jgi:hypothetical protein
MNWVRNESMCVERFENQLIKFFDIVWVRKKI